MTLAALEATLALYRDPAVAVREIPVLRMLTMAATELGRVPGGSPSDARPSSRRKSWRGSPP